MTRQLELFGKAAAHTCTTPAEHVRVKNLLYVPSYLSSAEQRQLLMCIDGQPWLSDLQRRVQHYGYRYDYKARRVEAKMRLGPLPDWAQELAARLHDCSFFDQVPDQAIVNEYTPGQGISPHVDCEPCFGPTIASVSLGSPVVMVFTHVDSSDRVELLLETGSLVLLRGDARYLWKHSIPARKTDRVGDQVIKRNLSIGMRQPLRRFTEAPPVS